MNYDDQYVQDLQDSNKALMRAIAALVVVAGGEVEVPDSVVASIDDDDEVVVTQHPMKHFHVVKVIRRQRSN